MSWRWTRWTRNSFKRLLLQAGSALHPSVTVKLRGGKWDLESPSAHSYPSSFALDRLMRIFEQSEGGRCCGFVQLWRTRPVFSLMSEKWETGLDRTSLELTPTYSRIVELTAAKDCGRHCTSLLEVNRPVQNLFFPFGSWEEDALHSLTQPLRRAIQLQL